MYAFLVRVMQWKINKAQLTKTIGKYASKKQANISHC
jgi:hypothetical protein